MNFVCIVFELGDTMLTLSSMENLIVQCNHIPDLVYMDVFVFMQFSLETNLTSSLRF